MAKVLKTCKVCGKQYEYCHTALPGIFRWQDVACCREHAQQYFERVEQARAEAESNANDESAQSSDASESAEVEPATATPSKRKPKRITEKTE